MEKPEFAIPEHPHFDPESTSYFIDRLARAEEYLEYGSGGSTVEAARLNKNFTTVESDPVFLEALRKKIGSDKGRLIHADIGPVENWGVPIYKRRWPWRRWRWKRYATIPWKAKISPDLVLIDGRFRVLCGLYTLKEMVGQEFEILFDDYRDRDFYHGFQDFAELKSFVGRMAIFGPKQFDDSALAQAIERYSSDWR